MILRLGQVRLVLEKAVDKGGHDVQVLFACRTRHVFGDICRLERAPDRSAHLIECAPDCMRALFQVRKLRLRS